MQIIDGKKTAAIIRQELKDQVAVLTARHGRAPGLAVILVGGDPASQVYVRNKERACEDVGIISKGFRLPEDIPQAQLEDTIMFLNSDPAIDGLLLQLPLPKGLDSQRCLDLISPSKDVDGFHPVNMGRLALGLPCLRSCTPAGIMTLMERHGIDVSGKKAVVIGRSNIVGKPLALMLLQKNATVTVCHSRTRNIAAEVCSADIVLAAVGIPKFVTRDMVKPGAVVIDVGINRTELGLVGDCDFEGLQDVASAMTPVPGGVGPMTIAQLLVNTVEAYVEHMG
ncbi:methylenetetrahydrofolate dehydrogenase (NADP+) / methenyltetrahydrofolate cyclohydrolase [Desulfomicrobium apsheronum]|uniref:Bifunctional protein FolD n=3 Tax=Desulfomicrobium TaxID=898 RepID=A0A1I3N459_9BACT|nr:MULTISPECIES: bifunctional methylenetetrahydrofolate dehydrogenase/methenyltetrahydrofolate cyclohydrolase FolD [Desulfomicrobium]MBE1425357.1 methylenetetrahydrofolate dehydrogenase (NADP+)/methenyltetrahydrofolate cyclohydrolase [Desulfomicrobium macestii]SFJ03999.1 methylenetetrahydrofolate dehydrogenase (NADP+) / methenyltetrahydrofolate cyclohydrolase [Desulfomicrobium apsheronum]SFL45906.1 methylenetetrahydrofolate dehydrogenase (NADP+) / methenyltetrahydrofolate cyclohydrolase [Desulfo